MRAIVSVFFILGSISARKLVFVNELVRHGARAPINADLPQDKLFNVAPGELTPTGMREKYLVGHSYAS